MRIGELARLAGTTPKAIRLYEALGLLGAVARVGSYRQYGESDLGRVRLIRQAQALGFRLSELDGLHTMHTHEGWARIAALVAGRRTSVARELQRLRALDHRLADHASRPDLEQQHLARPRRRHAALDAPDELPARPLVGVDGVCLRPRHPRLPYLPPRLRLADAHRLPVLREAPPRANSRLPVLRKRVAFAPTGRTGNLRPSSRSSRLSHENDPLEGTPGKLQMGPARAGRDAPRDLLRAVAVGRAAGLPE